jgi:hypothetical protein
MSSWLLEGHLYLYLVVLYNVQVDTSDATYEKFIPFHPGFSELHLIQCYSSGKNIDSDDGDTASL